MKIVNDVIRSYHLKLLVDTFLNQNVWSYLPSVVDNKFTDKDVSFGYTVYQVQTSLTPYYINDKHYNLLLPLIFSLYDAFNLDLNNIFLLRVRLGLILKQSAHIINTPHVDFEQTELIATNHHNILYYFNTTDAPTHIYKERSDNIINTIEYVTQDKDFNILNSIPCIENSAVMFDGSNFHSSSTPTDTNWRLVLNINLRC